MKHIRPRSNLWFISVATLNEAGDFSNWLHGKRKMFNDTMEFRDWMEAYEAFPLEIYFDGVVFALKDRKEALFFLLGFEAAINAIQRA